MNPLQLIPAKGRAAVYILAAVIGVAVPFILPDVPAEWQHGLGALIAVAALFGGGQGLSNLVPDRLNPAMKREAEEIIDSIPTKITDCTITASGVLVPASSTTQEKDTNESH